ncbi:MAG: rSAM/selenodomain-associated transferase 1 [Bacteroidia bacterium]|jgi:rSAM/selenodomain-associated transferase 1
MATETAPEQASLLIIQFAREPQPGHVKTRMLGSLSPGQACELHCELTEWTLRQLLAWGQGDVELCVAGDCEHPFFEEACSLGAVRLSTQSLGNLGQRMYAAMRSGLSNYERVLLVGSDCPGIDPVYLACAMDALDSHELVLGPAHDGGYVLIGARSINPVLFQGVDWGTEQVFAQTIERAEQAGKSWFVLKTLSDIDRPEDLPLWHAIREAGASAQGGE